MPDNRTEFILSMRDDASAVWNKFNSHVVTSSKSLVDTIKNNWMGMSASVIAAVYSMNKAFDMAGVGAKLEQTRQAFKTQLNNMGLDAKVVFDSINENAAGLIDEDSIMAATNRAIALGVPVKEIAGLMLLARQQARIMGTDVETAFEKISEGVGRANPRLLVHAGIRIKLKDISKEERAGIEDVTGAMGSEADMVALLTKLHEKYIDKIDVESLSILTASERHQQLQARLKEMQDEIAALFVRLEAAGMGVVNVLSATVNAFLTVTFGAMEQVEKLANLLHLGAGTYFQQMRQSAEAAMNHLLKKADESFSLVIAKTEDLAGAGKKIGDGLKDGTAVAVGSIKYYEDKIRDLKSELEKLNPTSTEAVEKAKEYNAAVQKLAVEIENLDRKSKGLAVTFYTMEDIDIGKKLKFDLDAKSMDKLLRDAEKIIGQGMGSIGKPIKTPMSGVPVITPEVQARWDDQTKLLADIGTYNFDMSQQEQLDNLKKWEDDAVELAHGNEALITQVQRVATQERNDINRNGLVEQAQDWQRMSDIAMQSISMVTNFMSQQSDVQLQKLQKQYNAQTKLLDKKEKAELHDIEYVKKQALKSIDEQLARDGLSQAQRANLTKQRAAIEEQSAAQVENVNEQYLIKREQAEEAYRARESAAKLQAFKVNQVASSIQAIINTALGVTGALTNPLTVWMVPWIEALGAAQVALILAQPTPEFHTGTGDKTVAEILGGSRSGEYDIRVRGDETIRTPEQENNISRNGMNLTINIGHVADKHAFKRIIQQGMRELGVTDINKYIRNDYPTLRLHNE